MTIKSGKSRERVPQKGITLTYQQSSSEEATKAIENMKTYLSEVVKEKDHYLLFPNSIPSELMVFHQEEVTCLQSIVITPKNN